MVNAAYVRCDVCGGAAHAASLPHIGEDYMGRHWLASFALLALEAEPCDK